VHSPEPGFNPRLPHSAATSYWPRTNRDGPLGHPRAPGRRAVQAPRLQHRSSSPCHSPGPVCGHDPTPPSIFDTGRGVCCSGAWGVFWRRSGMSRRSMGNLPLPEVPRSRRRGMGSLSTPHPRERTRRLHV
ncbi:hypothetical protein DXG01_010744, partial [Tephrocybe rancida]